LKEGSPKGTFFIPFSAAHPFWVRVGSGEGNKKTFINVSQRILSRSIVATIVKIRFLNNHIINNCR